MYSPLSHDILHTHSKDSPGAQRAAIVDFANGLVGDKEGMDRFVYMMVRSFVPKGVDVVRLIFRGV